MEVNPIRGARASAPLSKPAPVAAPSATTGPSDEVSPLGMLVRAMPIAASLAVGAAAAGTPPPASQVIRIATELQDKGFALSRRRMLWIPLLMKRDVPLTPAEFSQQMEKGSTRLRISSDKLASVEVKTREDLDALDAFYLGGGVSNLPHAALADSLNVMARQGWRFTNKKQADIGPYGAWRTLRDSAQYELSMSGPTNRYPVALDSAQAVHRVRFFQVDHKAPALEHPLEAQTLLDLADKGARFHEKEEQAPMRDAESAYRSLFVDKTADRVWAGSGYVAAFELTPQALADPLKTVPAFEAVMKDVAQVEQAYPQYAAQEAWKKLKQPIAGEDIGQRLKWAASIKAAVKDCDDEVEGFACVRASLRPGEKVEDALHEYVELRSLVERYYTRNAAEAYQALREHFDETAPGPEPPDERRKAFIEVFAARPDLASAKKIWASLGGPGTCDERVAAFKQLLAAEQYDHRAIDAMAAVVAHLQPGESVTQGTAAYLRARTVMGTYETAQGIAGFDFIRGGLAAALPGPFNADERESMYLELMKPFGGHNEGVKALRFLTGETDQQKPAVDPEIREKIQMLVSLCPIESGYGEHAKSTFTTLLQSRRPGEPLTELVKEYGDLRARLEKYDFDGGRKIFTFLRGDLDASMAGPSSPAEKRAMYIALLDRLKNHDAVLQTYATIAGPSPGADMPERVACWGKLVESEDGYPTNGTKALAAVDAARRPGEKLEDAVAEYGRLRGMLPRYAVDDGCALFKFHRLEIGAAMPGPWSDDDRRKKYEALLGLYHSHAAARAAIDRMCLRTKENPAGAPPADLLDRIDAFVVLSGAERYGGETVWRSLEVVLQAPSGTLADNTADYIGLRGRTQSGEDAAQLFQAVRSDLPAGERGPFLKVHSVFNNVKAARAQWDKMKASPAELAERVDGLVALSKCEKQGGAAVATALDAVLKARAPGETIAQACADFESVRKCCSAYESAGALAAFTFMREHVEPSRNALYRTLLGGLGTHVVSAWTTLETTGSPSGFDARLRMVASHPPDQFANLAHAFGQVKPFLPTDVDPDRALLALVPVAASCSNGMNLVVEVVKRAAASAEPDRAATLEWMSQLMAATRSTERFDKAVELIAAPAGAGTVEERRVALARLLDVVGLRSWETAVEMLQALQKVQPAEFAGASALAVELAGAMKQNVTEARDALKRLIDARASGLYGDAPLDVLLSRFGELYTAGGSVDRALSRLEQEARSGALHIENNDEFVVIGGIKVPKNR